MLKNNVDYVNHKKLKKKKNLNKYLKVIEWLHRLKKKKKEIQRI